MSARPSPFALASFALLASAALFPVLTPNPYYLGVMALAFVGALSALGLNLVAGYAGQLNLAHAGFVAIGAYTVGILTVDHGVPFWIAFALAGVVSAAAGAAVGLVSLRLRGDTFAIFTLCVGFILYLGIEKWDGLTRGVVGLMDIPAPPGIGPVSFATDRGQYYLALGVLAVGVWLMRRITASLVGRSFLAIRNGEALAQALGLNPMRTKLTAFVISTFYAGIAGALYAGQVRFLGPDIARETRTFDALIFAVVGGMGTLLGPVVGAVGMSWAIQALQGLQDYRMVVFGPLLVLCIMFFPAGIVGALEARFARRRAALAEKRLAEAAPVPGAAPRGSHA
ncbi:branched-chain amino acid ABC transporter permease [Lichenibacterium minor]|nr:branched-chain amino acid ABC transporter permease [Lichenibacterium minor]